MHANCRPVLGLTIALVGCVSLSAVAGDAASDAKKELQGTWQPIEAKIGEGELTKEQLAATRLTIKDDGYTVTLGEKVDQGTWKIDADAKPKTMDITGQEGPNKGKTFLCIYEISGDSLTVAYSFTGKDRPTEFKTGGDPTRAVIKYERKK
jgi:hypothetical protein